MTKTTVIGHPNHIDRIDEVYVFVAKDATGNEGIPACEINGIILPLVCADKERIDSLRRIAKEMGDEIGIEVKLVRYSTREELETITEARVKS